MGRSKGNAWRSEQTQIDVRTTAELAAESSELTTYVWLSGASRAQIEKKRV